MKSNYRFSLIILFTGIFILNFCKKDSDSSKNQAEEDIALTDEQAAFLDTVRDTIIKPENIIMSNGQDVRSFLETYDPGFLNEPKEKGVRTKSSLTPRLQKETFLARMFISGELLVDRSLHTFPADGADNPAQNGLAYSWGSKDYNIRQVPPGSTNECTSLKIYGLDCTGMIWAMTTESHLPPVEPKYNFFVERISDATKWTNAFKASDDFKDLKMEDKGQIAEGDMKNGDIIFWRSHIGVYLYGFVYQSNGTPRSPGCNNNLSASRGPRMISVSEVLGYGLGSYKVFRVTSGDDYTITIEANLAGYINSSFCVLGNYKEKAIINFTVKEDDIILNYINNYNPSVTFSSAFCNCLDMSFDNKSAVEVTDFSGYILRSGSLWFNLVYTFCSSTEKVRCSDGPLINFPGHLATGVTIQDSIKLPKEGQTQGVFPLEALFKTGTLTVARDE